NSSARTKLFSLAMGTSGRSRGRDIVRWTWHRCWREAVGRYLLCLMGVGGGGMADEDRVGLAGFLSDLRAEVGEAQPGAAGDPLKLGVEEISLTLEVAYTLTKAGEASAGVQAKFWVFASAQAGLKGSVSSERAGTQQLTLTLKPRVEQVVIDRQ